MILGVLGQVITSWVVQVRVGARVPVRQDGGGGCCCGGGGGAEGGRHQQRAHQQIEDLVEGKMGFVPSRTQIRVSLNHCLFFFF